MALEPFVADAPRGDRARAAMDVVARAGLLPKGAWGLFAGAARPNATASLQVTTHDVHGAAVAATLLRASVTKRIVALSLQFVAPCDCEANEYGDDGAPPLPADLVRLSIEMQGRRLAPVRLLSCMPAGLRSLDIRFSAYRSTGGDDVQTILDAAPAALRELVVVVAVHGARRCENWPIAFPRAPDGCRTLSVTLTNASCPLPLSRLPPELQELGVVWIRDDAPPASFSSPPSLGDDRGRPWPSALRRLTLETRGILMHEPGFWAGLAAATPCGLVHLRLEFPRSWILWSELEALPDCLEELLLFFAAVGDVSETVPAAGCIVPRLPSRLRELHVGAVQCDRLLVFRPPPGLDALFLHGRVAWWEWTDLEAAGSDRYGSVYKYAKRAAGEERKADDALMSDDDSGGEPDNTSLRLHV